MNNNPIMSSMLVRGFYGMFFHQSVHTNPICQGHFLLALIGLFICEVPFLFFRCLAFLSKPIGSMSSPPSFPHSLSFWAFPHKKISDLG